MYHNQQSYQVNPQQASMVIPSQAYQTNRQTSDSFIPLYPQSTQTHHKFILQGYKDVWCALLFLLFFFGTAAYGSYNLASGKVNFVFKSEKSDEGIMPSMTTMGFAFVVGLGYGAVCTICSFFLFATCAFASILLANLSFILVTLASGFITYYYTESFAGLIVAVVVCLLRALFLYLARDVMRLTAVLLRRAALISKSYPAVFIYVILFVLIGGLWFASFSAMLYPFIKKEEYTIFEAILFTLAALVLFWVQQVLSNLVHVTISGLTATWYFFGTNMPSDPTYYSAKRALTTSLGSVCLGSLLVAIVQVIKAIANSSSRDSFTSCLLNCLLSCIESLLKFFNKFAFVYVAIYGMSYIEAGRATYELLKRSLFYSLANNTLMTSTLFFFSLAYTIMGGLIAGILFKNVVLGVLFACAAFFIIGIMYRILDSAIISLFVCVSEEPEVMAIASPDLNDDFHNALNQVPPNRVQTYDQGGYTKV